MQRTPDPLHDHAILTRIHWAMIAIAAIMAATLIGALGGSTPAEACQGVGLAGLAATVAAMWYASTNLTGQEERGPLAPWAVPIRRMAWVNAAVAVAAILLPYVE